MYKAIKLENGKFGLQRQGSTETHGEFDSFSDAMVAAGQSLAANVMTSEETR